jgi:multimeric flavodoxin WrbA
MKALILNGSLKEDKSMATVNKYIEDILEKEGYEVESVLLHEKKIGPCLGCFGCWVRTPGICVIDDYGRILTENIIKSDVVIYLTPVVYGGYSSELKKALDRIIPLLLPFFKKIKGEVHHVERYEKYPKVVVLGMMSEEDNEMKEIFNSLINRNSLNWYNSLSGGVILNNPEEGIKGQLEEKLKVLEVATC